MPDIEDIVISLDTDEEEEIGRTSALALDAEVDLSYKWKKRAAVQKVSTTVSTGATVATVAVTKRKADH